MAEKENISKSVVVGGSDVFQIKRGHISGLISFNDTHFNSLITVLFENVSLRMDVYKNISLLRMIFILQTST